LIWIIFTRKLKHNNILLLLCLLLCIGDLGSVCEEANFIHVGFRFPFNGNIYFQIFVTTKDMIESKNDTTKNCDIVYVLSDKGIIQKIFHIKIIFIQ